MCGIAGYFGFRDIKLLKNMLKVLRHRGPDDEGIFLNNLVALGNRRLAIIDIKGGKQPIHNENKTIWITFNGEIYNFLELRDELIKRNHRFYTKSDTETIVHAYEEWGVKCLQKFNGMFAFAIYDSRKKLLFLARDRFGIKPLYYYFSNGRFIFASEIKAILQDKSIPKIPNDKIIYQYLVDCIYDHAEETFFHGIMRLLPAHYIIVNKNGMKIKKYWDAKINKKIDNLKDDEKIASKFYELFEESIKRHLISEVPVGTCLSGGLDSSAIVCLVNQTIKKNKNFEKIVGKKQKSFSAVYKEKDVDEREYINEVVKFTGIEKNITFPSPIELWRDLRKFVYYQEEPVGGTNPFAQWFVMKLASKKVTVLLDGQGGDEILAGYLSYFPVYFRNLLKKRRYFTFSKEFFASLDITLPLFKKFLIQEKKRNFIKSLLNEKFVKNNEKYRKRKWETHDLSKRLYLDLTKLSLPKLLRYEDKSSMAFSIEARVPFLDYKLVEFVSSLPINQKIRNGWTKFVMRNALKEVIPEKIRLRRSKLGFPTPEDKWLKVLKNNIVKILESKQFKKRVYFNHQKIRKKFEDFVENRLNKDYSDIFWRILNLEIWLEEFID